MKSKKEYANFNEFAKLLLAFYIKLWYYNHVRKNILKIVSRSSGTRKGGLILEKYTVRHNEWVGNALYG